jgi:hypothetical protein
MRARSCNFALRNRLKRDRSPDVRDMRTSFLVLKNTSPVCRRLLGVRNLSILRLPENCRGAIVHNA